MSRLSPSAVGFLALFAAPAAAQLNAVALTSPGQLTNPVFATSAPGTANTLYVVQQGGQVRPLDTQTGAIGPTFLDLAALGGLTTGGETGLLGLAFHPQYANPDPLNPFRGRFYVQYTAPGTSSPLAVKVDEFTATGGVVNTASRRTIISFDTPKAGGATNHNAGWLGFSPTNGHLYITTGDSGSGNDPNNVAQDTTSLQGKMLRIALNDPSAGTTYSIPAGNITVPPGSMVKGEIYSYGLRNPYRASFDRATGDLYIGDVGQNAREEIDFIANGAAGGQNFGWRVREGLIKTPGVADADLPAGSRVDPIFDYAHTTGNRSITGGYVYRGLAVDELPGNAPLDGTYFFADFVSGRVFSLRYDGTAVSVFEDRTDDFELTARANSLSSLAEDGAGNLYLIDINGTVYSLVPVPEPAAVGLVASGVVAAWVARRRRLPRP